MEKNGVATKGATAMTATKEIEIEGAEVAAAAVAAPAEVERLRADDLATLREYRQRELEAVGEAVIAQRITQAFMATLGRRYGLAEGDRLDDEDGRIVRGDVGAEG